MSCAGATLTTGPGRRGRAGVWRLPAALALLLVVLALAGCYELKEEVIPAGVGEAIPYAYESADLDDGGKITFSRSTFNNDYRFREVAEDGDERLGTFRALRIKGNIYAVQARYDDESTYSLLFYAINPNRFATTDIGAGTDLKAFAARYGVEFAADDFSKGFTGDRDKILAMLRALSEVEFQP